MSEKVVLILVDGMRPDGMLQCGQYPWGELNENECGAGSGREIPVSGQTRCFEK